MGAPYNKVGIAYQQEVFATLETTKGTLVYPSATDAVVAAGFGDMNQNPTFTDSEEIFNTRDLLNQFQDMTPAGTFTLPIYLRPSGVAGSKPMGDVLFTSLFGKKTVTSGVSVVYSQQTTKPSMSLWCQNSHTVFGASGAVVDDCKFSFVNKGGVKLTLSGQFLEMYWAGTDAVNVATASIGATSIPVYDAKKYTVGTKIYNVTLADNNSNTGYLITGVNTSTNTLTLGSGILQAWSQDNVVAGFLPAPTLIGSPLENRKAVISILGATKVLQQMDFDYADKVKVLADEITGTNYPIDYIEDMRALKGSFKCYFRQNDVDYWTNGQAGNTGAVSATIGSSAGKIATLAMPQCRFQVPKKSFSKPAIVMSCDFTALGNVGEDSVSLSFT